ncbi:glycoside hydrolase family 32 protein [Daedalea quercina L-15889]|uniref:Glycoside hydrolase family 32 protein n=1 Tax=Daedalea quercina L-15889 TaxID=1314783 RepID=A0A165S3I2_9APHY|nr:glycoside hydrolase family 32 protein [Daedalea quercina L-15889]
MGSMFTLGKVVRSVLIAALSLVSESKASAQDDVPTSLAGVDLSSLQNNTLFTRWRPTSHFIAPHSWMNDPCGPSYDHSSGLYHLFYQFHPAHIAWGNISWGHATSEDLATWTDVEGWEAYSAVAIPPGPNGSIDHLGVFTGSAQFLTVTANQTWGLPIQCDNEPLSDCGTQTVMLVFHTAVKHLPIGWSIPYTEGAETQALAISYDGGFTWSKFENTSINPVIATPPPDLDVTGFRDPFFELWPEMDSIIEADEPHFYAAFGSGIQHVGPRLQFYTAPVANLTHWSYLGPLFSVADNSSWSETYSGSYGNNFEVAGTFSLPELVDNGGDGVTAHHFVMMGTEGEKNWPLWSEVDIVRSANGSAESIIRSSGVIDWGASYAWNSFYDEPHDRRITFGWISEDLNTPALLPQGWAGATSLPREIYVQVYQNLANTNGVLSQPGSWTAVQDQDGRWNMTTLAMRPAPDVVAALRQNATMTHVDNIVQSASVAATSQFYSLGVSSDSVNLHAEIDIPVNTTASVGFVLRRSPDGEEQTVVIYDPVHETLTINLTSSTLMNATFVNNADHIAPLFLLDTYNSTDASAVQTTRESLTLDIFLDNSIIEVFANSRAAMIGRVYPARVDSLGIGYIVGPGSGQVVFKQIVVWEGLEKAWPGRPDNTSTQLVYDTSEETNNYTWWVGY